MDDAPLQGLLRTQGRSGLKSWRTVVVRQEGARLHVLEKDKDKDVLQCTIDMRRVLACTRGKQPTTFVIITAERQHVYAPLTSDDSVIEYWINGISAWMKANSEHVGAPTPPPRNSAASLSLSPPTTSSSPVPALAEGGRPEPRERRATMQSGPQRPPPPPPSGALAAGSPGQGSVLRASPSKTPPSPIHGESFSSGPVATSIPGLSNSNSTGNLYSSGSTSTSSTTSSPTSSKEGAIDTVGRKLGRLLTKARTASSADILPHDAARTSGSASPTLERLHVAPSSAASARGSHGRRKSVEERDGAADKAISAAQKREKIVAMQKAFLDFRRLLLKTQLMEGHMRALQADAELMPAIQRLEGELRAQQDQVIELQGKMREWEAQYYEKGAELSATFRQMLNFINLIANGPLQGVAQRMQTLYKQLVDAAETDLPLGEIEVLVGQFRAFLPVLEDALLLDKPLMGRQHAMREKLQELTEQNKRLSEQARELDEAVVMTAMDCETIGEFTERSAAITDTLQSVHKFSGDILPWMRAPTNAANRALSEWSASLLAATGPLQPYRETNFLDRLAAAEADEARAGGRGNEMEFGEDGSLQYISVDKLVELCVSGKGKAYSMEFDKIFIFTFRQFIAPLELLEKLILIYCTTPPDDETQAAGEHKLATCRLRILNILKKWITTHHYDFSAESMSTLVHAFCDTTLKLTGQERMAESLIVLLAGTGFPAPMACPDSIRPSRQPFELSDLDPLELARQLTLEDQAFCTSLEARDFLNCSWNDKNASVSRTIKDLIACFNSTAEWIVGYILGPQDDSVRAKYIRHFILTADACLKLNNFNGCIKILGALSGQAVFRLSNTWERVSKDETRIYQDMRKLMDSNWAGLRELMAVAAPPRIVYMGAYLADLTYINEMKTKSSKSMYNFRKMVLTGQAIDKILQHQDVLYWFHEVAEIRRWINVNAQTLRLSGEAAHKRSVEIQARGQ